MLTRLALGLLAGLFLMQHAYAIEMQGKIYGSLRTALEYVHSNADGVDDVTGMRDAYSRLGITGSAELNEHITASFVYELGIDSTTGEISTLNFDGEGFYGGKESRISKVSLTTDYGKFSFGKMWSLYYNAVAYPVDRFSTYYAGWSTFALFRTSDTLAYQTPDLSNVHPLLGGFYFAGGVSFGKGDKDTGVSFGKPAEGTNNGTNTYTLTAGYSLDATGTSLNVGYENNGPRTEWADTRGTPEFQKAGIAASQNFGALHSALGGLVLAGKYERVLEGTRTETDEDLEQTYWADGAWGWNVYLGYTFWEDQVTLKGMYGNVEGITNETMHFGIDYMPFDNLKFYAEYYQDEGGSFAPINFDFGHSTEGGSVISSGLRLDF